MRTIKLILGIGCFALAVLPGGLAILAFMAWTTEGQWLVFLFTSILIALAIGLVCTGSFFVAHRGSPISWKARALIILPLSVGILTAVALPNFINARCTSCANACINNLRQIDAAANEFALEHDLHTGAPINFPNDLTPYIKLNEDGKIPSCPQGGIYSIRKVGDAPTCSLGTNGDWGHRLP